MIRIRSPQDCGAAVTFIAIGLAGLLFGQDLASGSASQMGPGYFPKLLSGLILLLGLGIGARSVVIDGPPVEAMQLRPISCVVGAILLFGVLVSLIGLALTALAVTFVAALARPGLRPLETLLLGGGLALFVVIVFVYVLGQPLPAWWGE